MRGAGLILLVFLVTGMLHYSRWASPEREQQPAVVRLQPQLATIVVADSRGRCGLYQFNDGSNLFDVIKLTDGDLEEIEGIQNMRAQPVISGEIIKLSKMEGKYFLVERSWIPASHRMLLHIPLHPDRMTPLDWEALPGIGPKLAAMIEGDRQKNGDFKELSALRRVKGIGLKKLEAWQAYFIGNDD